MEAGLARSRRSFMYQQMSFPATQDRQYHHYQVSAISFHFSLEQEMNSIVFNYPLFFVFAYVLSVL